MSVPRRPAARFPRGMPNGSKTIGSSWSRALRVTRWQGASVGKWSLLCQNRVGKRHFPRILCRSGCLGPNDRLVGSESHPRTSSSGPYCCCEVAAHQQFTARLTILTELDGVFGKDTLTVPDGFHPPSIDRLDVGSTALFDDAKALIARIGIADKRHGVAVDIRFDNGPVDEHA